MSLPIRTDSRPLPQGVLKRHVHVQALAPTRIVHKGASHRMNMKDGIAIGVDGKPFDRKSLRKD